MKNLLMIAALFISVAGFAQTNKEELDYIQSIYGHNKKQIVADFVVLQGEQKDAFWKLYDEYEVKRKDLGKDRYALLEKYVHNYSTMDAAMTDDIMKQTGALAVTTDKLVNTYYGKIKKASGAKAAAQFMQIEYYLLSVVRAYILEEIPFIGELEK